MALQIDSVNGLTFADSTQLNSSPIGFKNRIINGDMRIDQRNGGAAITVTSSFSYAVDRMASSNTTGTGTITGQRSTLNGAFSLLFTATAALTDITASKYLHGLYASLEAYNVYDLNSKTVTVSFKVQTNWSGKLPVCVRNYNFTRSYVVDVSVTSGVNNIVVTLPLEAARRWASASTRARSPGSQRRSSAR